jgi:hypothetical protein
LKKRAAFKVLCSMFGVQSSMLPSENKTALSCLAGEGRVETQEELGQNTAGRSSAVGIMTGVGTMTGRRLITAGGAFAAAAAAFYIFAGLEVSNCYFGLFFLVFHEDAPG